MPGLQADNVVAALGSPVRRSRLSLKFLHKKETKRALDFSEPPAAEPKTEDAAEPETSGCDQVVPGPSVGPSSPGLFLPCDKRETLVPFVGFNNLGNTCYLNSVLQVLYYCPGLRDGIQRLYSLSKRKVQPKEESDRAEEPGAEAEAVPAQVELLGSFNSLITSVEQLQSDFLLNPSSFSDGDLATPPRKILHTLRQLNPMYEGCLQHDAQEVLQCILGYIQEACDTIKKEQELQGKTDDSTGAGPEADCEAAAAAAAGEEEGSPVSGKRKSDTEVGNAKKKSKSVTSKKPEAEEEARNGPCTRSKRRSSSELTPAVPRDKAREEEEEEEEEGDGRKTLHKEEEPTSDGEEKTAKDVKRKKTKKSRLSWLRPSGKQPSIFSKFRSVGKISSSTAAPKSKDEPPPEPQEPQESPKKTAPNGTPGQDATPQGSEGLDLMERLFQGQLVLRTRCLECESFTERREDFQDISVPVLDEQPSSPEDMSEVSPDPKPELKTLTWALGQFASVERIVGEDKYFCETCRHYTEAERSLLFDKTPEVVTIHLKRFSASSLELNPYAGLSKVNTPLQTPLSLSLDEWCTRPSSAQRYQLFAVVMHSGVTISSGHYTAYVRVSDLSGVKLRDRQDQAKDQEEEEEKPSEEAPRQKEEAPDYDDGEVSFSLGARRGARGGKGKKPEGGVGLLGGQRSVASYDIGTAEGSKRRKTASVSAEAGLKKEAEEAAAGVASCGEAAATEQQALDNLLQYEGKWLLFDDSEVRLFEEEDFLRACSPDTCSSSTPYLLFYRRTPPAGR
ncbi:uncharacterized protein V6R79_017939 [Siganus canaliculatus]